MITKKYFGPLPGYPELRGSLDKARFPTFGEMKIDGELNHVFFDEKKSRTITLNKYGLTRRDFPMLNAIEKRLKDNKVEQAVFIGELYWKDGKLGRLYDLLSHKKDDMVQLNLFDIMEINYTTIRHLPLLDRKEKMLDLGLHPWCIKSVVVHNRDEAIEYFEYLTSLKYEGLVLKEFDEKYTVGPCRWVKIKYKDRSDYKVVSIDPTQERIAIEAPVANYNGPVFIEVGVKAPNRYKKHIKIGDTVTIEHQGVLVSGSLRHPVLIPKREWR